MKYIRTKDGIYESEKCAIITNVAGKEMLYTGGQLFNDFIVIMQADTVEELVDELVAYDNGGINKEEIVKEKEAIMFLLKQGGRWTIYGAIWTKAGLIYVAKMNEKGELELL